MDALKLDTVRLSADRSCLEILDQTLLPGTVKVLQIDKIEDIFEAIRFLRVRGRRRSASAQPTGLRLLHPASRRRITRFFWRHSGSRKKCWHPRARRRSICSGR